MDELDELGRMIDFEHAEKVNIRTLYYVALLFYKGDGYCQNYEEAAKWFEKVAEQKFKSNKQLNYNERTLTESDKVNNCIASAQYYLGIMFRNGKGGKQNYADAVKWFEKAAGVGHKESEYCLGRAYYTGDGIEQNFGLAVSWYRKAAEQGYADAQNIIGDAYRDGNGVGQDYRQALEWYRKAADQGNAAAQNSLGDMYAGGLGVEKNLGDAMKWYMNAAQHGNADARSNLEKVIGTLPKENLVHR